MNFLSNLLDDKPIYKSKTVWGIVLFVLLSIAESFGVSIDPETVQGMAPESIFLILKSLAGGLGLFGIRDAMGRIIKGIENTKE